MLKGVLCEVCDIDGLPQAALLSAVSLIKPWSLFIIGHLCDAMPKPDQLTRDAGIQALSFNGPANLDGDAEFLGWAREAERSANRVPRSAMIYDCSARRTTMAGMMGATRASVGS